MMKQLAPESLSNVGNVSATEDVNLTAGSEPGDAPCTCLSHAGDVSHSIHNNNGRLMAKISNAIFDYLRKIAN